MSPPRPSLSDLAPSLRRLSAKDAEIPLTHGWNLKTLAGRFVELSASRASASLSLAFTLVLEAQRYGENVAWVSGTSSTFFPPDVADSGVDLDALIVVRTAGRDEMATGADWVMRSGLFALVVIDLISCGCRELPTSIQSRLSSLAQKHTAAFLCLTEASRTQSSLGSLVSLRAESSLHRRTDGVFDCALHVLKDKHGSSKWQHVETRYGTPGLH